MAVTNIYNPNGVIKSSFGGYSIKSDKIKKKIVKKVLPPTIGQLQK
jgi:hypothetical protein